MTRILVTGSRNWNNPSIINTVLKPYEPYELCHGGASGADRLAGFIAKTYNQPVTVFPAKWDVFGKAAGHLRNQQMLDEFKPTIVLAFPMPGSIGTWDMIRRARKAGVPTLVYDTDGTLTTN